MKLHSTTLTTGTTETLQEFPLEKKTSDFPAKIISYLFHPLLMPTYGLLLYFFVDSTDTYFMKYEVKKYLLFMTFSFTFLLPLINALILLKAKFIQSLHMETKEERRMPLLVTAVFFVTEYWLLHDKDIPQTLKLIMLSASIAIVLTVIINMFWKISAHMVGIGGIVGSMFVLSYVLHFREAQFLVIFLLFTAGIIGSARLWLKAHTPLEVLGGFLLGAGCPFIFLLH